MGKLEVSPVEDKMKETHLRWFSHDKGGPQIQQRENGLFRSCKNFKEVRKT